MAKKKIKAKKGLRIVIILLLIIVLGIFALDFFDISSYFVKYSNKEKKQVEVKVPQDYEMSLFMVGDALIHSSVYQDARTGNGFDFKPQLELIKPIASKYDLAYYNQETVLGGPELGYSNYPRFNSPYEVGDAFIDAGFDLVSLATNHTMDKNEQGVLNSVAYWKKHPEVVTSGQWSSYEDREASITKVHEKNGIKYAFLSYTTWTNGLETPYGKDYLNNVYSDEKAKADIEKIRDKVDIIIVAMHWGTEYSLRVDYSQAHIADFLSEQGVALIIGAHPHVVEPVEYINDGKTFVIYSLGNLISDQEGNERLTGLMMSVKIKKKVDVDDKVTVTVEDPHAELTYTKSYYGGKRNFKVYPYSQLNNSILSGYESLRNKYQGVVSSRYSELKWGVTGE
ncbi:MAG: CapA family protein [Bacilli bacterium]|nr:CapA family protein [Bacilli bacterium]